jgi:hypothetical protein
MTLFKTIVPRLFAATSAICLIASPVMAESLLDVPTMAGTVKSDSWTSLSYVNGQFFWSNNMVPSALGVVSPGYAASDGLYSYNGAYSMWASLSQPSSPINIKHAVFQIHATWPDTSTFPINGGPKLSYNGGTQRIAATLPMMWGRSKEAEGDYPPEAGRPTYHGVMWQWDLSSIPTDITSIKIEMPFDTHTSLIGCRIDVSSQFQQIGVPADTPLQTWRQTHFQTKENTGAAADLFDADFDGVPNLIEYALGRNPKSAAGANGAAALPVPHASTGRLQVAFSLPETPPAEITYKVRVTEDFSTWKTLATKVGTGAWTWNGTGTSQISTSLSGGRSQVTVGDEVAIIGRRLRLMRLEVSY